MATRRALLSEPVYFILTALLDGPMHGYGIIKRAEEQSGGRVRLAVGTLYGALDRLFSGGLIALDHEEVVDGRPRRYYRITDEGTRAVTQEAERMRQAAAIVIGRAVRGTGTASA
jgi:DNA-binding PadR family transcriptional regulator